MPIAEVIPDIIKMLLNFPDRADIEFACGLMIFLAKRVSMVVTLMLMEEEGLANMKKAFARLDWAMCEVIDWRCCLSDTTVERDP